jgi:hypothetical protein
MDKDFGKLVFAERLQHRGLVRLPDVRAEARIETMKMLLETRLSDLEARCCITVRGGRVRISRPPLDSKE